MPREVSSMRLMSGLRKPVSWGVTTAAKLLAANCYPPQRRRVVLDHFWHKAYVQVMPSKLEQQTTPNYLSMRNFRSCTTACTAGSALLRLAHNALLCNCAQAYGGPCTTPLKGGRRKIAACARGRAKHRDSTSAQSRVDSGPLFWA